ncbi:protein kinase [Telluria mixta]|uniref:Protein kinase n=1 Tax=Telluria mixta TaxID=34071 RepID=A0ABT2C5S9_9BURK|nr:serine/threonine-protein kinase [Telluria mixta]MCS0632176.1 protein kinase [Telluria mixta]WEM99429.1 protein kinase [Telluria mixta]
MHVTSYLAGHDFPAPELLYRYNVAVHHIFTVMAATTLPEASRTSDQPPRRGQSGHYELRARLGEGGFGEVHEAWDTRLHRSVAIKAIRHGGTTGTDLVREARLAASLRHPAFVKVHAVEEDGAGQFIVMELVHGRTLKQILQEESAELRVALPISLDWISQVADAMRDAHASGLVHGDIKPSNLMVEPDGRMRILDFGLALRQDALATETVSLGEVAANGQTDPQGTIAYMAPERLQGATPDPRADVYALGVILYELVCGKRPFATLHGLALAAALVQTSSDGWDYPDRLDTPLIALIRAMTARQPEQRVDSMAEVARRIAELTGKTDAGAPRAPVAASAPAAPRRAVRIGAAAALGIALVGGLWWQMAPRMDALTRAFAPYSEAIEMEQGLAALKQVDVPDNLDKAEARFDRILKHNPDSAAAVAGKSIISTLRYISDRTDETWLRRGDAGAQQAMKLNDQLALSHIAQGWVRDTQGRREDALAAYERALRLDPSNFFAWWGKTEALRHARRYAEAQAAIAEAARRFPRERVFSDALGTVYYEQSDLKAAEQAFRHSIVLQPDAVRSYANLSAVLMRQNRADEALRVLQQGLEVRPSATLYTNLGNILFLRGEYVGAADAFENAVSPTRGAPGSYQNWANLADTLLWIPGRGDEARQAYEKARRLLADRLERSPNDVVLVSRMGLYAVRSGHKDEAPALLTRALALAPASADVQFRAGLAYELLGDRKRALAAIAAALRLGYPVKYVEAEPDLVALRRDPDYHAD